MKLKETNIADMFDVFCKKRHKEDGGKNYNLLQEVYASTELFDFTKFDEKPLQNRWSSTDEYNEDYIFYSDHLLNKDLPFSACFCKIFEVEDFTMTMFIREYLPQINTGLFTIKSQFGNIAEVPFTIYTESGYIAVNKALIDQMWQICGELSEKAEYMNFVLDVFVALCSLPKYAVASDIPIRKIEYYTRKKAETIKVENRPIYYILNKKEEKKPRVLHTIKVRGTIEFSHAFKVRGHYMRINPNSIGKDRSGKRNKNLKGVTWRNECVKNRTKEFIRKVRIVK